MAGSGKICDVNTNASPGNSKEASLVSQGHHVHLAAVRECQARSAPNGRQQVCTQPMQHMLHIAQQCSPDSRLERPVPAWAAGSTSPASMSSAVAIFPAALALRSALATARFWAVCLVFLTLRFLPLPPFFSAAIAAAHRQAVPRLPCVGAVKASKRAGTTLTSQAPSCCESHLLMLDLMGGKTATP